MSNVEGFVPGTLVALVLAVVLCPLVARWLRCPRPIAALLVLALGVIVSATLTPLRAAATEGIVPNGCDLSRIGLIPLRELETLNDTSLNVLLFTPLGLAVGLLRFGWRTAALGVAVTLLPFAIEATQLVATSLHRGCQSADVVDNLTGLLAGFVVGSALRLIAGIRSPGPA